MFGKTCMLCPRTSLKRWFGNRTMTSNCDVTNSAHHIQMTTLCHWMKPLHENFLRTAQWHHIRIRVVKFGLHHSVAARRGVLSAQRLGSTVIWHYYFNIIHQKWVATLLLRHVTKKSKAKVQQSTELKMGGSKRVRWVHGMDTMQ